MYMHSFNETLEHYRGMLLAQQEGRLQLPNDNFDTGEPTKPTAYPFADEAYAKLLARVSGKPVSVELRSDILVYYADLGAPFATKKDPTEWQNVLDELGKLKASPAPGPEPEHPE
jgi:hypothetical protein